MDPAVNNEFLVWLNNKYGEHGAVTATREPIHEYLGMQFNYSQPKKVIIDMIPYMQKMVDEFPAKLTGKATSPAATNLMAPSTGKLLDKCHQEIYHT